ncbi:MAG: DUF2294 domain-containing protein [Leptolyngbyaceae cyanobacterium]
MTSITTQTNTRGKAQRALAQKVQRLYKNQIGHSPGKVTCQIIDNTITVIAEDSLTKLEQLLLESEKDELTPLQVDVEQVRSDLETAIRPLFVDVIQETLSTNVVDVLSDTTLETGRTAIVAILADSPEFTSNDR